MEQEQRYFKGMDDAAEEREEDVEGSVAATDASAGMMGGIGGSDASAASLGETSTLGTAGAFGVAEEVADDEDEVENAQVWADAERERPA